MIFPLYDDNEQGHSHHHHDYAHWGVIFICVCVFAYEIYLKNTGGIAALNAFGNNFSFNPKEYLGTAFPNLPFSQKLSLLLDCLADIGNLGLFKMMASSFVHADTEHLLFNMLALWFIGDNVEYAMGHLKYVIFFLLGGIVSDMAQVLMAGEQLFMPTVGASGSIFAVSAAYLLYFPRAKFIMFYFFGIFWGTMRLPAWLVLGGYIVGQLTMAAEGYGSTLGNVAVWGHIGGFICGVVLAYPFRRKLDHPLYSKADYKIYTKNVKQVIDERRNKGDHWDEWGP